MYKKHFSSLKFKTVTQKHWTLYLGEISHQNHCVLSGQGINTEYKETDLNIADMAFRTSKKLFLQL